MTRKSAIAITCTALIAVATAMGLLYAIMFNRLKNKNFTGSQPFEQTAGWCTIETLVNGQPTRAIFDTAAGLCLIDSSTAVAMDIKPMPIIRIPINHKDLARLGIIKELRIGPAMLRNVPAIISPIPQNGPIMQAASFIMGINIIKRLNWDFDFDRLTVTISSNALAPNESANAVQLSRWGIPKVEFNVMPKRTERTILDFGSTSTITLPITHAAVQPTTLDCTVRHNIHGQYTRVQYDMSNDICLGNDTLRDVRITYTDDPPPLVGLGLIRRYRRCILNFSSHEMLLMPPCHNQLNTNNITTKTDREA